MTAKTAAKSHLLLFANITAYYWLTSSIVITIGVTINFGLDSRWSLML